ncbi:MAG: hypothetical protein ACK4M9_20420 [Anaerobacillus sp.]|uniref:hypothetical protein n=1 Tax=Anaerobacillus sp. TaxID=1872506 RepID=UPI00391C51BD
MGYIPPIRDEQAIQYGNRFIHSYHGIVPISPVMKSDFHSVLADKQKPTKFRNHNQKGKNNKTATKNHNILREMTGKGHYIDEVV